MTSPGHVVCVLYTSSVSAMSAVATTWKPGRLGGLCGERLLAAHLR
jgi:hypothetical protein